MAPGETAEDTLIRRLALRSPVIFSRRSVNVLTAIAALAAVTSLWFPWITASYPKFDEGFGPPTETQDFHLNGLAALLTYAAIVLVVAFWFLLAGASHNARVAMMRRVANGVAAALLIAAVLRMFRSDDGALSLYSVGYTVPPDLRPYVNFGFAPGSMLAVIASALLLVTSVGVAVASVRRNATGSLDSTR